MADNRPSTDFDSDDGEELNEVDEALRRALERREQPTIDDSNRRLSRESVTVFPPLKLPEAKTVYSLEQGFRDDSDEEIDDRTGR